MKSQKDIGYWIKRNSKKPTLQGALKEQELRRLVQLSDGRCRWTGLPLRFDAVHAGGASGRRTDPLYAEVDHREPGSNDLGHDLVCHHINDAKGQMPWRVWLAATKTDAFAEWIADLQREWTASGTLRGAASLQRRKVRA